jgi:hypothetical protein
MIVQSKPHPTFVPIGLPEKLGAGAKKQQIPRRGRDDRKKKSGPPEKAAPTGEGTRGGR